MSTCKPDSTGADWFMCHRSTVGCPYVHEGLTPHCIGCSAGDCSTWHHDPPVLEMTKQAFDEKFPELVP